MRASTAFRVSGIEPGDPEWGKADDALRRDFWRVVVRLVKDRREYDQARGLDRFGRKLRPITMYTRTHRRSEMGPADPNAPPLTPADGASRTVAYFDGRAYPDHAEFFWRNGWGRILHFHRIGAGRLPVRDVIGISPKSVAYVRAKAHAWWDEQRRNLAPPPPPPQPVPAAPAPAPAKKPRNPMPRNRIAASPILVTRSPKGKRKTGKILVYSVKNLTGPPTIGESMTGQRIGRARQ